MILQMLRPMARANLFRAIAVASRQQIQKKTSIPPKLANLQKKFQEKNDLPVHLKGGPNDRILYLTTLGLAATGLTYLLVYLVLTYIID